MSKLLLMGPLSNVKDPSDTGGAVVLFKTLIDQLKKQKISFLLIDTNKKNYPNLLVAYFSIILQILMKQQHVDKLSLHSSVDFIFFAPVIIFIGKLLNKKTSLRKFGGEAEHVYNKATGVKKNILHFVYKNIDSLFLEMKFLVAFFSEINPNTYWFPNVRERKQLPKIPKKYDKKFVFIGHVKKEKGIDEILNASMKLDGSFKIDIYGPISDAKYNIEYFKKYKVQYLGHLLSQDVPLVLNKYDVLLLPSYKEGYPGIVIEAYSVGLPVIATNLQGLKEIVEPNKTGVLISLKNTNELVNAMESFNNKISVEMSKNAYLKFREFNSETQTKLFLKRL